MKALVGWAVVLALFGGAALRSAQTDEAAACKRAHKVYDSYFPIARHLVKMGIYQEEVYDEAERVQDIERRRALRWRFEFDQLPRIRTAGEAATRLYNHLERRCQRTERLHAYRVEANSVAQTAEWIGWRVK
jgi:hypothetical protein